uniref:Trans-golgi network vesicle protein 23-like protein A n=1 Tax=Molossus molossus TaxID=27622 RepID=A0A7J8J3D1_MOLMO|nr:trans-golgi network vesicle protein 23-like protein A [Molossus molossus]
MKQALVDDTEDVSLDFGNEEELAFRKAKIRVEIARLLLCPHPTPETGDVREGRTWSVLFPALGLDLAWTLIKS